MSTATSGRSSRLDPTDTDGGNTPPSVSVRRRKLRPYILSIPATAVVVGILYPFAVGVYYSFLNFQATNPNPILVGVKNYISVLGDPLFWGSVKTTGVYAVSATGIESDHEIYHIVGEPNAGAGDLDFRCGTVFM